MLHILWTILKILGILLLVILGIVLFVILAVLFVPFRYSVAGEKYKTAQKNGLYTQQDNEQQVIKIKIVASWLAHLVHFCFRLQTREQEEVTPADSKRSSSGDSDKQSKLKTDMELYLLGIPVFALKNKISANSKKSNESTNTKVQVDTLDNSENVKNVTEESTVSETTVTEPVDEITEILEEEINQDDNSFNMDAVEHDIPMEEQAQTKQNPIQKLFQTIQGIPGKIKTTIENIKLTIKKLCDKIRAGSDFLKNESTKATIRLLLGKLKNIIVHILPKKVKGNLIFGFDDPALTGEILGVASLFYPKYQKKLKLIPVFEQQILEGKVQVKGRIVIAYIIWQAIKIVLDKNAKLTFQNAKKLVAEIKK